MYYVEPPNYHSYLYSLTPHLVAREWGHIYEAKASRNKLLQNVPARDSPQFQQQTFQYSYRYSE
ncbi:hypothetical protein D3C71_1037910 [compost metagenome]